MTNQRRRRAPTRRRPTNEASAAEYARAYVRNLFGGEEPDHEKITSTLFLAAFESCGRVTDAERRRALLRRVYERAYEEAVEP